MKQLTYEQKIAKLKTSQKATYEKRIAKLKESSAKKKKKLKKKVPKFKRIASLKKKCDKALQDYYRSLKRKCVVCGALSTVVHHHVPVSRSAFLRYSEQNLVSLCQGCHMQHHNGDPSISFRYRQFIDEDYLMENQHTYKKWSEDELLAIIERFNI